MRITEIETPDRRQEFLDHVEMALKQQGVPPDVIVDLQTNGLNGFHSEHPMVLLDYIEVPEDDRHKGIGGIVMRILCGAADHFGIAIALRASDDDNEEFFWRFGFEGSGRMVRNPQPMMEAATLKLRPNQTQNLTYFPFVIVMRPLDFIRLTCPDEESVQEILQQSRTRINPDTEYVPQYADDVAGRFYMPSLFVRYPSGVIEGHEGRHRAASVYLSGGKTISAVVRLSGDLSAILTYRRRPWESEDETEESETFNGPADASDRKKDLRALNFSDDSPYHYTDFKIETFGGNVLKGHPDRSEGWAKAPWRLDDFPDRLIGQFNPSIILPHSAFRVGINKFANTTR